MIKTNIPREPVLYVGEAMFRKGDRIRIQKKIMGGYIGEIAEIKYESIVLNIQFYNGGAIHTKEIALFDINKIRRAEPGETFDTVPYYDAEEKEFWRTHWYTKDGIKEKTLEDIKMLEAFFANNK